MNKNCTELGYPPERLMSFSRAGYDGFQSAAPCPSDSLERGSTSSSRASVRTTGNRLVTPFILR
ncbi:MAG: hypothetical protein AAB891_00535 [Patescibacteria group bacterium]